MINCALTVYCTTDLYTLFIYKLRGTFNSLFIYLGGWEWEGKWRGLIEARIATEREIKRERENLYISVMLHMRNVCVCARRCKHTPLTLALNAYCKVKVCKMKKSLC